MATLVSAQFESRLIVNETLALETALYGKSVSSSRFNRGGRTYSPDTTPPATKYYGRRHTLSGALTLDVTALTDNEGVALDATGLKLQLIRVYNRTGNTGSLTVSGGDANPYEPFGAGKSVVAPVGAEIEMAFNDNLADVSATVKTLKFAGTSTDVIDVELLFG